LKNKLLYQAYVLFQKPDLQFVHDFPFLTPFVKLYLNKIASLS
jgi:hypothetical protein